MGTIFVAIELGLLYAVIDLLVDKIFIGVAMFSIGLTLNTIGLNYFRRKYLKPVLNNEPAMELDDDSIQYNIDNWGLSWNEIESIDNLSTGMRLYLKNGNIVYITFQYISSNYNYIADCVTEYFENAQ